MRRAWWVLLGLALAGALLWLFLREPSPETTGTDALRDAAAEGARTPGEPRLVGLPDGGPAAPSPTTGRLAAYGRVVDAANAPLAGVPVEVCAEGSWSTRRGYYASERYAADQTRASAARRRAAGKEEPPVAVVESDQDGRFVFRTDREGSYTFRPRVDPPHTGTHASATLFENALQGEMVVRVLEGVPLAGRVIDAADHALEAAVDADWRDEALGRWSGTTRSDATSGAFLLPAVPRGRIALSVTTPERFWRRLAVVESPTDGEVVLRIPAGVAALRGRIHDAAGEPVPGAVVEIRIERAEPTPGDPDERPPTLDAGAVADEAGVVDFGRLPTGRVNSVLAAADGFRRTSLYRGREWPGIALGTDEPATFDVTLLRGSTVEGRVLSHPEGRPLPGATVTLYFLDWAPPQKEVAHTDADGHYRFEHLGAGRFLLLPAHASHYCPELEAAAVIGVSATGERAPPPDLMVTLDAEDGVVERDLRLAAGGRVAGRVEDEHGDPVAGAEMHLRRHGLEAARYAWSLWSLAEGDSGAVGTSGADGTFVLEGVPPRADWVLFARKRGAAGCYADPVEVRAGETTDGVVVRLAEPCIVRGQVLDESGVPLGGQSVRLSRHVELCGGEGVAYTDAEGRFEFDSLAAAPLTVTAYRQNGQRAEAEVTGLVPGEVREGVVLAFTVGLEIEGTVVDARGEPVASLAVFLRPSDTGATSYQTHTDGRGGFVFRNLDSTRMQLETRVGGMRVRLGDAIAPPARGLRIRFERPATARLKVSILGPDGTPIPRCRVRATSSERLRADLPDDGTVKGGSIEIEIAGEPPYDVSATHPTDADGEELNLRGGFARVTDPAQPVVLRFEAAQDVAGIVVDEDAKPVPGVRVRAQDREDRSGPDGRWRLLGLDPGDVALQVDPPSPFVPPDVLVVPEGARDVRVQLTKGLAVAGRVVMPKDVPLVGGTVTGSWSKTADHASGRVQTRLTPTGAFRLSGIPPDVRIRVTVLIWQVPGVERAFAPAVVEDVAPGTEDLEIVMALGVVVSGRVVDERGAPVREGSVSLRGTLSSGSCKLDAEGRFTVGGLRPGRHEVHVYHESLWLGPLPAVDAPATDVRIVIPDTGLLQGTLEGVSGEEGWRVGVIDAGTGRMAYSGDWTPVAPDGTWTVEGVPRTGPWVVTARRNVPDDRYARSQPVEAGRTGIVLRLATGARIEGRVEREGRVLPGCGVSARAAGWVSGTACDEQGRFTLRGLPPGTYDLTSSSWEARVKGHLDGVATGSTGVVIELDEEL